MLHSSGRRCLSSSRSLSKDRHQVRVLFSRFKGEGTRSSCPSSRGNYRMRSTTECIRTSRTTTATTTSAGVKRKLHTSGKSSANMDFAHSVPSSTATLKPAAADLAAAAAQQRPNGKSLRALFVASAIPMVGYVKWFC